MKKPSLPPQQTIVQLRFAHRLKVLFTGKLYVTCVRDTSKVSGVRVDGVAV